VFSRIDIVLVPPVLTDLTTLATVKLDMDISDTLNDAYILRLIRRASSIVQGYCKRDFAMQTWQSTFRLDAPIGGSSDICFPPLQRTLPLNLGSCPVASILSAVTDVATLVQDTDYELAAKAGQIFALNQQGSGTRSSWQFQYLTVQFMAGFWLPIDSTTPLPTGYMASTLPDAVEQAAIELVRARWYARKRDPMLRTRDQGSVGSESYWVGKIGIDAEMPDEVASLLLPYVLNA
jgi:hypothetical protein